MPARAFVTEVTDDVVPRQGLTVTLGEPLRGVAPGQAVVLYQGTVSWGGRPPSRPARWRA